MRKNNKTSNTKQDYKKGTSGKRPQRSRKEMGREEEFTSTDPKRTNSCNDPAWYSKDPALLRDSASIPYSWAVGTPIDLNIPDFPLNQQQVTVPGVCALYTIPSVGYAENPSSPINVAATSAYTFVRHQNSGSSNYDAPDLMLYLIAMSQVYSYINFLQRTYGIATLFSQRNRYMPDALLTASGVDTADVQAHLADFRYGINALINKAASFSVPNTMPYFQRQAFLYQNVYTEGTSIKDQLYMFVPYSFYRYNLNPTDSSGMLELLKFYTPNLLKKVDDLIRFGNDLIYPLLQSEDMNIMSGDILKAYGEGSTVKLSNLPVDYTLAPIFDIAVLEQMKNAIAYGAMLDVNSSVIQQDPTHGFLVSKPNIKAGGSNTWVADAEAKASAIFAANHIITTTTSEVTPELTMENTRLMPAATWSYSGVVEDGASAKLEPGSELLYTALIFQYLVDEGGNRSLIYWSEAGVNVVQLTDETDVKNEVTRALVSSHFKFHPQQFYVFAKQVGTTSEANIEGYTFNFDVDNYAVVNNPTLARMNEAALLSMLNVPSYNKIG